jgi:hypothetical protein
MRVKPCLAATVAVLLLSGPHAAKAGQPAIMGFPGPGSYPGGQAYQAPPPPQHPFGEPGGGPQQPLPPPPQAYGEPGGSFAPPQNNQGPNNKPPHRKPHCQPGLYCNNGYYPAANPPSIQPLHSATFIQRRLYSAAKRTNIRRIPGV